MRDLLHEEYVIQGLGNAEGTSLGHVQLRIILMSIDNLRIDEVYHLLVDYLLRSCLFVYAKVAMLHCPALDEVV
jgi:hypothetical protein